MEDMNMMENGSSGQNMLCPRCGGENNQTAAFCMHCGNTLSKHHNQQYRETGYNLQEDVYNPDYDVTKLPENIKEGLKRHEIIGSFPIAVAVLLSVITMGLFAYIYYGIKFSKLPKAKQDDFSAGKAIGFLFIPFVNLGWVVIFWMKLVDRINLQFRLRSQKPLASKTLAVAMLIVFYASTIITYATGVPVSLIGIVMVAAVAGNLQFACNKLSIISRQNIVNVAGAMGQESGLTVDESTGNTESPVMSPDLSSSYNEYHGNGKNKKLLNIFGWILTALSAALTIISDISLLADNSNYVLGPIKGFSALTLIVFLPMYILGSYLLYKAYSDKNGWGEDTKDQLCENGKSLKENRLRQIKFAGIYGSVAIISLIVIFSGLKIFINTGERTRSYDKIGVYEGRLYMGQREGTGTMRYENGDEYKGQWLKDKKHGQGVYTYANGDVYEGRFLSDRFNGKGKMNYANGDVYEGEWRNGKRNGQGTLVSANGEQVKGEWRDNTLQPPKSAVNTTKKGTSASNLLKNPALGTSKSTISSQAGQRSGELTIEQGNKPGDFKITMTGNKSEYCFDTPKVNIGPNLKVPVSIFSARIDSQGMLSPGIKAARTTMSNAKVNTVYGTGKSIASRDVSIGNMSVEGLNDSQYIMTGPEGVVLEKNGTNFTVIQGKMELVGN